MGRPPPTRGSVDDWKNRKLHAPGTHYKYNDVRVNVLAYSLLQVLRKPLPAVLKEHIMDPIGASSTWRWFGYENSWVNVDGQWMQSVSGGGHSGGGVFISTEDHARFGLLFLAQGKWKEQQLFPKNWVDKVVQPAAANPNYGMMWWLNNPKGSNYIPEISDKMYYAAGFGETLFLYSRRRYGGGYPLARTRSARCFSQKTRGSIELNLLLLGDFRIQKMVVGKATNMNFSYRLIHLLTEFV